MSGTGALSYHVVVSGMAPVRGGVRGQGRRALAAGLVDVRANRS